MHLGLTRWCPKMPKLHAAERNNIYQKLELDEHPHCSGPSKTERSSLIWSKTTPVWFSVNQPCHPSSITIVTVSHSDVVSGSHTSMTWWNHWPWPLQFCLPGDTLRWASPGRIMETSINPVTETADATAPENRWLFGHCSPDLLLREGTLPAFCGSKMIGTCSHRISGLLVIIPELGSLGVGWCRMLTYPMNPMFMCSSLGQSKCHSQVVSIALVIPMGHVSAARNRGNRASPVKSTIVILIFYLNQGLERQVKANLFYPFILNSLLLSCDIQSLCIGKGCTLGPSGNFTPHGSSDDVTNKPDLTWCQILRSDWWAGSLIPNSVHIGVNATPMKLSFPKRILLRFKC